MKILYITTRIDGIGGLQRTTVVKLNYWAQLGYTITLLTTNSENQPQYYTLSKSINHISVNNKSNFFAYKKLLQSVYNKVTPEITIVADNGLKGFLTPYFLPHSAKIIFELHASRTTIETTTNPVLRKIGFTKILLDRSIKKFDRAVFLTPYEARKWNTKNSIVIPNPLAWRSANKSNLNATSTIYTGRMLPIKGIDLLLQIWKIVSNQHPNWILNLYGETSPTFDITSYIENLGLKNSVKLYAASDSIADKYRESSIYLCTSRQESFGLSILEAMECGLPIVSFDLEGPSSILTDTYNGFLVPKYQLEAFAKKVIAIIEDENLRQRLGQNASKTAENYSTEKVMQQWDQLLKSIG